MRRSPMRWRISVGTRIADRMPRTSISRFISSTARAAAGLAPSRRYCPHHRLNRSSSATLGAQKARQIGVFPGVLDVRDEARDENEIERRVAHDLVGNAVVAALGVARRRSHSAPSPHSSERRPLRLVALPRNSLHRLLLARCLMRICRLLPPPEPPHP